MKNRNPLNGEHISLFAKSEKGQGEWKTFSGIREDAPGMFRVKVPVKKQPRYGTVVPIKRYPGHFEPRTAH